MLTEARVILPGAQALFGFQLAIVLTEAFEKLSSVPRLLHASHCSVSRSRSPCSSPQPPSTGSYGQEKTARLFADRRPHCHPALVPLAIGMAADCYVVLSRMSGQRVLRR